MARVKKSEGEKAKGPVAEKPKEAAVAPQSEEAKAKSAKDYEGHAKFSKFKGESE